MAVDRWLVRTILYAVTALVLCDSAVNGLSTITDGTLIENRVSVQPENMAEELHSNSTHYTESQKGADQTLQKQDIVTQKSSAFISVRQDQHKQNVMENKIDKQTNLEISSEQQIKQEQNYTQQDTEQIPSQPRPKEQNPGQLLLQEQNSVQLKPSEQNQPTAQPQNPVEPIPQVQPAMPEQDSIKPALANQNPAPQGKDLVPAAGEQNLVQPAPQGQNSVQPAAGEQNLVQAAPLGQNSVQLAPLGQNPVQPAAGEQNLVEPAAPVHNPVQPAPQGQNSSVQPAAGEQNLVQLASQGQNIVQLTLLNQNPVQPASPGQNIVQPTLLGQNPVQPAPLSQNPVQPASPGQNIVQPTLLGQNPVQSAPSGQGSALNGSDQNRKVEFMASEISSLVTIVPQTDPLKQPRLGTLKGQQTKTSTENGKQNNEPTLYDKEMTQRQNGINIQDIKPSNQNVDTANRYVTKPQQLRNDNTPINKKVITTGPFLALLQPGPVILKPDQIKSDASIGQKLVLSTTTSAGATESTYTTRDSLQEEAYKSTDLLQDEDSKDTLKLQDNFYGELDLWDNANEDEEEFPFGDLRLPSAGIEDDFFMGDRPAMESYGDEKDYPPPKEGVVTSSLHRKKEDVDVKKDMIAYYNWILFLVLVIVSAFVFARQRHRFGYILKWGQKQKNYRNISDAEEGQQLMKNVYT